SREQRGGCANEGGRNGDDEIRAPENLEQHDGEGRESKCQQMQNARAAAGELWNPKWRPPYIDAIPLLASKRRPTVIRINLPLRVVGRRDDRPHLVSTRGKPGSHFSRVFADARGLGSKVDAINEDLHALELHAQRRRG